MSLVETVPVEAHVEEMEQRAITEPDVNIGSHSGHLDDRISLLAQVVRKDIEREAHVGCYSNPGSHEGLTEVHTDKERAAEEHDNNHRIVWGWLVGNLSDKSGSRDSMDAVHVPGCTT